MPDATEAELSSLTDEFYRAALNGGTWQPAMARLKTIANGSKIHFARVGPQGDWQHFYRECDPYYEATFMEPHLKNPFLPYLTEVGPLNVVTDQTLMPKSEFRKTAMFNEWYVPQGDHSSIVCKISVAGSLGILAVQRGGAQPDFDDRDTSLFRALVPVVARAAEFHVRFGGRDIKRKTPGGGSVGQIVVDGVGRVLIMNASAETLLAHAGSDLALRHGRLFAGEPLNRQALRTVIATVCGSMGHNQRTRGDVLIRCGTTGLPRLALTIVPYTAETSPDLPVARAALVVIQDLSPSVVPGFPQYLRGLFELTQKEAELGAVLVSGRSLQYYASQQQVSYETARTHLRNIFQKTATSRQGELVALLNRVLRVSHYTN